MRKLNPFQMPQVQVEPQSVPIASTSDTTPCGERAVDKQMLVDETTHELQVRVDDVTVMQPCSSNPDFFNIVLADQQQLSDPNRPRQYGRRSNPVRISSFAVESSDNGNAVRWEQRDMSLERVLI